MTTTPVPQSSSLTNDSANDVSSAHISCLKRRIASLEQEAELRKESKPKKKSTPCTMGRGIRRLVVMFDPLEVLVAEADRRCEEDWDDERSGLSGEELEERIESSQDRVYRGYTTLLSVIPSLRSLLNDTNADPDDLDNFVAQLQKGANDARSDDVRRIKEELGGWLNHAFSPSLPFSIKSHGDRGLQNDITGRLLCPIQYEWDDEATRTRIKSGSLNIADDLFLSCFYPKNNGDPNNVEAKFLRSRLLLKTYCAIFTSPSSSEEFEEFESVDGPSRKKKRTSTSQKKATKASVATLLHMNSRVTPRSIAYAAVVLAFNLTDAVQWVEVYNGFNFCVLWSFIVDYFEETPDEDSKSKADELLQWWNKQVFPQQGHTVASAKKSHLQLLSQRLRGKGTSGVETLESLLETPGDSKRTKPNKDTWSLLRVLEVLSPILKQLSEDFGKSPGAF
ncbi:hypothetical protein BJ165DRAFT_1568204 [Panaeolus papilionaceus]|nr:hypothetical protein BJ165DRAFT_1568204 [Panaeolus papilionaceus]